ncbi:hypothetical protein FKM82_028172 [Ascaphus truei]
MSEAVHGPGGSPSPLQPGHGASAAQAERVTRPCTSGGFKLCEPAQRRHIRPVPQEGGRCHFVITWRLPVWWLRCVRKMQTV